MRPNLKHFKHFKHLTRKIYKSNKQQSLKILTTTHKPKKYKFLEY